jgi:hypothetical protein
LKLENAVHETRSRKNIFIAGLRVDSEPAGEVAFVSWGLADIVGLSLLHKTKFSNSRDFLA